MSLLALPRETYATICADVDRADLAALCRISRLLRGQAERILYRTVDLPADLRLIKSWCLAVTRHSHLGARVHALSLPLPISLDPVDAGRVSRALVACNNLKELAVLHFPENTPEASIQTWILEEGSYQLTQFANTYFQSGLGVYIEAFLDGQPDLQLLSLPFAFDFSYSDALLQNLIALDACMPVVEELPATRPLERLQVHCARGDFLDGLPSLHRYSSTLTTLILVREGFDWGSSTVDIVEAVASAVPGLLHFGISEAEKLHTFFSMEESPIRALQRFTQLDTFTFRIGRGICFWSETEETTYNSRVRHSLKLLWAGSPSPIGC
ncbi:hypothetical protein C8J57DRAFT_1463224 [Mycena rebaudengoi]|nr:hypothetical protein C8J57DRAFT_1463224 [Mycena rebaudengoi]